jgi:ABC-2 type transport system permease protein
MTSSTPHPLPGPAALRAYEPPRRVTQARALRSEWTKLRSQPSAFWALLSAVTLTTAFGILYSLLREARQPHGSAAIRSFGPVSVSLSGIQLAQIAVGVLGVLLITSEYATGLIRTTLAAVPRRLPVLWGKAGMLAAATVAVSLPAALAAFPAGQSILGRQHLAVPLSQPGVARAVIGSALPRPGSGAARHSPPPGAEWARLITLRPGRRSGGPIRPRTRRRHGRGRGRAGS